MTNAFNIQHIKRIHLIGIGGSGMSGIAEVLLNQGYSISGSDINVNAAIENLRALGAQIFIGHHRDNVVDTDVVVVSSAIMENNPELQVAHKRHLPVLRRAQMLGELMRFKCGIAIAGTHGKTTTTSLIASILTDGGLDPTFVIGGILNRSKTYANLGNGDFFVAEADESDASFLYLQPNMAIITNIDYDHMNTYHDDPKCLKQAFMDFIHRLPFYGLAVVCIDDPIIEEILPIIARPVITYGFSPNADVQINDFNQVGIQSNFTVKFKNKNSLSCKLNLPGRHNVLNAVAALVICNECGVPNDVMLQSLISFQGVARRFQIYSNINIGGHTITVIDDYGHHPSEIEATLLAIRAAWPDRRIISVFQPHRYSRTKVLYKDFANVLAKFDELLLLDIYPAGEKPIAGITSKKLAKDITKCRIHLADDLNSVPALLEDIVENDDIVLFQGAGTIGGLVKEIVYNRKC